MIDDGNIQDQVKLTVGDWVKAVLVGLVIGAPIAITIVWFLQ